MAREEGQGRSSLVGILAHRDFNMDIHKNETTITTAKITISTALTTKIASLLLVKTPIVTTIRTTITPRAKKKRTNNHNNA